MMTDSRQLPLPVNTSLRYLRALSLDQSRGRLVVGEVKVRRECWYLTTSPTLEHSLIDDDVILILPN